MTDPTTYPTTGRALRIRRWTGCAALPLTFVALLASTVLDKIDDSASTAKQVAQTADHLGTLRTLAACELLAAALFAAALFTVVGAVRGSGAGWANAAGVCAVLGTIGLTAIGAHHLFQWALVGADRPHAVAVADSLTHGGGPVIVLFFAAPIGLLLAAVATYRAGVVPRAALAVAVVGFVLDVVPVLPGGELIPLTIDLVAFTWIAAGLIPVAAAPRRQENLAALAGQRR